MTTRNVLHPAGPDGRAQDEAHLRALWNFFQRNRLLVLGTAGLVLAGTALFVVLATPIYEGSVSIRIDEQRSTIPVLDVLKTLSAGSDIETEMEVLRSRTLAEDVVDGRDLHLKLVKPRRVRRSQILALSDVSREAPRARYRFRRLGDGRFEVQAAERGHPARTLGTFAPGELIELLGARVTLDQRAAVHDEILLKSELFTETVKKFRKTLHVARPNRDADIVVARYRGPDPELVRAVPNAVASAFIARRERIRNAEAVSTIRFVEEQLDTLSAQLALAEDALREFREAEGLVSPEAEGRAQVGRLVELQAQRDLVDAERAALAQLLESVARAPSPPDGRSPLRRLIAFPTLLRNAAASELLRSLAEVENQRAELLNRRTLEDPDVQVLTERVSELEEQLASIARTYLEGLTNHVTSLDAALRRFGEQLERIPAREIQFARLLRQAKVLEEIYTMLQTRLKEAQIAAAVEDPTVRVVDPAIVPRRPVKPNVPLSVGLALVLGLIMGVGAAFARERMDTSVHTAEELQHAVAGAPVLALIPRIDGARATDGRLWRRLVPRAAAPASEFRITVAQDPRGPVAEAYRSLRTNIRFSRVDRPPRTLVFTSATPGDGKSTSAINLAATMAQQGLRCLLADADLRRGVLHELLGAEREPGLSNLLLGAVEEREAIQRVHLADGTAVDFLASGTLPPNPAELIGSERMRALLQGFEGAYDAIVMDTPPLNVVTDAALLGTNADGVILVVRAGVTERGAVEYATQQLQAVRACLLGAVLNAVDPRKDRYYGSYGAARYYYVKERSAR